MKNSEIKNLEANLRNREEELERLRKLLEAKNNEKKPVLEDESEEWRIRFNELQNRSRRDMDNYENELHRKDQIIMELRDKINQLLSQTPQVTQQSFYQAPNHDDGEKDALIAQLRATVGQRDAEIANLMAQLQKKQTIDYVQQSPEVVRIQDPNLKEVRYERDPYLVDQNARLSRQLEEALCQEQNAKNDLKDKIAELNRLHALIAELKAMPPKVVTQEKIVTKRVEVNGRIGDRVERIMDMYKEKQDQLAKRLGQDMLYYHGLYEKYKRLAQENQEKVQINQKLEVIDGTFDVWIYLRETLVDWLFEVFIRSADRAAQKKMNSFVLFKCNMEELKRATNDLYVMLINVYSRLKNLVSDDIPNIVWETKYEIPNPLPKDKLMHLNPEAFKKLKANQDIRDNINEWVEDTLFNVILRKRYDHSDRDKEVLFLYRLLAIKYRVTFPLKGESFHLDDDIRIALETKICNAALSYFNSAKPGVIVKGNKRPKDVAQSIVATEYPVASGSGRGYYPSTSSRNTRNKSAGVSTSTRYNEDHNKAYLRGGQQQMDPSKLSRVSSTDRKTRVTFNDTNEMGM